MSSRRTLVKAALLAPVLLLPLAFGSPAPVGPPWISIEIPANPLDAPTRGAALLVHTYHHGDPAGYPLIGTAEGLIDGERVSVPLDLARTARPSVHAVEQQWPEQGQWVLTFSIGREGKPDATLLVELGENGGVRESEYYDMPTKILATRSVRMVPGALGGEAIDGALRAMAKLSE